MPDCTEDAPAAERVADALFVHDRRHILGNLQKLFLVSAELLPVQNYQIFFRIFPVCHNILYFGGARKIFSYARTILSQLYASAILALAFLPNSSIFSSDMESTLSIICARSPSSLVQ